MTEYVSVTDTAKLIRKQLKQQFPGVKFSVRSHTYAGGASIDIFWTDGPTDAEVSPVVAGFSGGGFDGSIDMAYSKTSWLNEDGSATLAHTSGTQCSRGYVPETIGSRSTGSAQLVHFLADYVFTNRTESEELRALCAEFVHRNGTDGTFGDARADRCEGCGNWPGAGAECFVAEVDSDRGGRIKFVCSPACGGRLIARHTSAMVPA